MDGKNHERLLIGLLPFVSFYLGWIHADPKLSLFFGILWMIGTFYITCDNDIYSRSTKRLWIFGWIINKLFKHRCTLHNVLFWTLVGGVGYYHYGWAWSGLIIPQGVHIAADKIL